MKYFLELAHIGQWFDKPMETYEQDLDRETRETDLLLNFYEGCNKVPH